MSAPKVCTNSGKSQILGTIINVYSICVLIVLYIFEWAMALCVPLVRFGCIPKLNFRCSCFSCLCLHVCLMHPYPQTTLSFCQCWEHSFACVKIMIFRSATFWLARTLYLLANWLHNFKNKIKLLTQLDNITLVFSKNVYFRYGTQCTIHINRGREWESENEWFDGKLLCIVTLTLYYNILHRHYNCWCQFSSVSVCVFFLNISVA